MSRTIAPDYQPALLRLREQCQSGCCPAQIVGGDHLNYGVFLSLVGSAAFVPENSTEGLELLAPERAVTVTGEERHLDVLAPLLGDDAPRLLFAELRVCVISRGKHTGSAAIDVQINGQRVGELTKAMSVRYLSLVRRLLERGARPGCEAVLSRDHRGPQLEPRLPRVDQGTGLWLPVRRPGVRAGHGRCAVRDSNPEPAD